MTCYTPVEDLISKDEIDGVCPACGRPTAKNKAASGCQHGDTVECEVCGYRPCSQDC